MGIVEIAIEDYGSCLRGTRALLETLQGKGDRVSAIKTQLCQSHATYLGFGLHEGVPRDGGLLQAVDTTVRGVGATSLRTG